jgi:hypothetical protein
MEKQITIVDQVKELSVVSGIAFEFEVQELTKLSKQAKGITSTEDDKYKEVKFEMVKKRNYIKSYCLEARRDIKAKAEGVSGIENALYEIFVPEENRLIEISKAEKEAKQLEERTLLLPERKERLEAIGDEQEALDENLLEMDGSAFELYYNERLAAKNEADRAEIARKQAEMDEKEQSLAREAETQQREETARLEGAKQAKQDAKDKEARRIEGEKKQAEQERVHQEQVEKEKKEAEDTRVAAEAEAKRKLEASKRFVTWLKSNGYTEANKANFKIVDNGDSVTLYSLIGNYQK